MAAHEADYVDPTAELGKEWLDIEARRNCRWEHSFECACVCRCVGACACVRACLGACAWGRGCACERVRLCVGACSRSLGDCSKDLHTQTAKTLKRCLPRLVTSINTCIDELVAFCPDMLKVEEDNPIIF